MSRSFGKSWSLYADQRQAYVPWKVLRIPSNVRNRRVQRSGEITRISSNLKLDPTIVSFFIFSFSSSHFLKFFIIIVNFHQFQFQFKFQSKTLKTIVQTPWYVRNEVINHDLQIFSVEEETKAQYNIH